MSEMILTKEEILVRLHEMFNCIPLGTELTHEQADLLDYNLSVIRAFVELQECRDFSQVGRLGFGGEETEEADEEEQIREWEAYKQRFRELREKIRRENAAKERIGE